MNLFTEKAADVMISAAEDEEAPVHLFLGKDAYTIAGIKDAVLQRYIKAWRSLVTATDITD